MSDDDSPLIEGNVLLAESNRFFAVSRMVDNRPIEGNTAHYRPEWNLT